VTPRFDVAVLGGGPAGTATALALKRRHPELGVALIERSDYSNLRIGETLHPGVEPLLRELEAWEELASEGHLPAYGTRALWGSPQPVENEFLYHRNGRGWHLDRRRFDASLARLAERRGVALLTGTRVTGQARSEGVWRLALAGGGAIETPFVVDATGRSATFARAHGARRILFDRLVGVFLFAMLRPGSEVDSYTLVEAWEEGWWYSSRLPDGGVVVACMTDPDVVRRRWLGSLDRWLEQAGQAEHTAARLGQVEIRGGISIHSAGSHRLDRFTGDGWLAVGDAALALDPLSSGGVFQALRSGLFAARAIADSLAGDPAGLAKHESFLTADFDGYLATRAEYYGREARWPESPFWRRRHETITLDPRQPIHWDGTRAPAGLHLPSADLQLLCGLCRTPRPAHEVVAGFKARAPVADQRIILALQDLLERSVLN